MVQVLKVVVILAVAISYGVGWNLYLKTVDPMVGKDLALDQMKDSDTAFQNQQAYNAMFEYKSWGWLIVPILGIILFIPEIMKLTQN